MPRINLLPWREVERRERKVHFFVALGGAAVAAAAVTFAANLIVGSMVRAQERRNDLLRSQISVLDSKIEEINGLEKDKQRYIARMDIIEKLQRSRPEIVHLFDTIVKTTPDGVYLTSIKQKGTHLRFEGVAQSSTRVSTFMRDIATSRWLENPALEVVQSKKDGSLASTFVLDADQSNPDGSADDAGQSGMPAGPVRRVARRGGTP